MAKRILSLAAMDKIIREAGAERVSEQAKADLADFLEKRGRELAKEAIRFAAHAGRKTVNKEDINLALKQ